MRRSTTLRGLLALASTLAIGFALAPTDLSLLSAQALAQSKAATPAPKTTTATSPDNTYGEGGSLTSTSDENYKLTSEVYKNKNGTVRETREYRERGEVRVDLYDAMGKHVGFYLVSVTLLMGEIWYFESPTGSEMVKNRDEALKLGMAASDHFAKTGEFPPPKDDVKTILEQPKLPSQEEPKTVQEQPKIQSKEVYKDGVPPQPQALPKAATTNTQSSAPKTCGEIKDQQTLLAMGCVSPPGTRPTVAAPRAPAVTPAANRSETDCFSDPACFSEMKAREAARERELKSNPGKGAPDYPPLGYPGYPMPGGASGYPVK